MRLLEAWLRRGGDPAPLLGAAARAAELVWYDGLRTGLVAGFLAGACAGVLLAVLLRERPLE